MCSVECDFAKNGVDFGYAKLVDKHINKYAQIFAINEHNLNQYKPTDEVITITDNNNSEEQSEEPIQPQTVINNNNNEIYTNLYRVKSKHKYACNWCDCAFETSSHSAIIKHLRNDHTVSQMLPNCSRSDDNDTDGQSTSESLSAQKESEKLQNENSSKDKTWQQNCREILDCIFYSEDSPPFQLPVDRLQYPEYSQVIDTPMDLTTVKEKLLADLYQNDDEFCKDMRLIFSNSQTFNTNRRSRIYSMTVRLSDLFEEKLRDIMPNYRSTINFEEPKRSITQQKQGARHLSGRERNSRRAYARHHYNIKDYENVEDLNYDSDTDYTGDQVFVTDTSAETSSDKSETEESEICDEHNNDNDYIEVRRSPRKSRKKVNFSLESETEDSDCYTWYTPRSSISKYKKRSNDKDYNYNDNEREKVGDCYDDNVTAGHSTDQSFNDRKIGRNEKKLLSDSVCRQQLEEKYNSIKELPERYRPPEWFTDTHSSKTPYFAQIGDEVVYFRHGHQLYIDTVRENQIYDINPNLKPHKLRNSTSDEIFAKIVDIKYDVKPLRLVTLRLNIMDKLTGEQTNTHFSVYFHEVENVVDFIILKQLYDKSLACDWKVGNDFRSIIDSKWWFGTIISVQEWSPFSHFHCFEVVWANGESESLSPWDLERIDEQTVPQNRIESVSVTRDEMNAYNVFNEHEWPECGKVEECHRISQGLTTIIGLSEAQEFVVPVDLNAFPIYGMTIAYPMDLSTIKSRVDNHYYRRVDAIKHDIKFIESNARQYNVANCVIVKNAKLVCELCVLFIEDQQCYDPLLIYLRITSRIEEPDPCVKDNTNNDSRKTRKQCIRRRKRYRYSINDYENVEGLSDDSDDSDYTGDKERIDTSSETSKTSETEDSDSNTSRPSTSQFESDLSDGIIPKKIQNENSSKHKTWQQNCRELLDCIFDCEDSAPFRSPVDQIQCPNYAQVIDSPMDLTTVKEKLLLGLYENADEFCNDMRLIFSNSIRVNTNKRLRIYSMTRRLSDFFENKFRTIMLDLNSDTESESCDEKRNDNNGYVRVRRSPRKTRYRKPMIDWYN